jgi:hypothetical protein
MAVSLPLFFADGVYPMPAPVFCATDLFAKMKNFIFVRTSSLQYFYA